MTLDIESSDEMTSTFKMDVINGLRQTPKRIPSKYFYDERGSRLFEEITRLPEYYLTRTEIGIFEDCLPQIAAQLISQIPYDLIEFGTGAGLKTQMLLNALNNAGALPDAFIPIDISAEQLESATSELQSQFPTLDVKSVVADFADPQAIEIDQEDSKKNHVIFFPGSSIGNFTPSEASAFLKSLHHSTFILGNTTLILGVDLVKDRTVIESAYNDSAEVTASFNLNLVSRLNDELYAHIPEDALKHVAFFNEHESRIEMHLEATRDFAFTVGNSAFSLKHNERILSEYSYKYSKDLLTEMLQNAKFRIQQQWTDSKNWFTVCLCVSE